MRRTMEKRKLCIITKVQAKRLSWAAEHWKDGIWKANGWVLTSRSSLSLAINGLTQKRLRSLSAKQIENNWRATNVVRFLSTPLISDSDALAGRKFHTCTKRRKGVEMWLSHLRVLQSLYSNLQLIWAERSTKWVLNKTMRAIFETCKGHECHSFSWNTFFQFDV